MEITCSVASGSRPGTWTVTALLNSAGREEPG